MPFTQSCARNIWSYYLHPALSLMASGTVCCVSNACHYSYIAGSKAAPHVGNFIWWVKPKLIFLFLRLIRPSAEIFICYSCSRYLSSLLEKQIINGIPDKAPNTDQTLIFQSSALSYNSSEEHTRTQLFHPYRVEDHHETQGSFSENYDESLNPFHENEISQSRRVEDHHETQGSFSENHDKSLDPFHENEISQGRRSDVPTKEELKALILVTAWKLRFRCLILVISQGVTLFAIGLARYMFPGNWLTMFLSLPACLYLSVKTMLETFSKHRDEQKELDKKIYPRHKLNGLRVYDR